MLAREECFLLGNMLKDCFFVEQFLFYLNQYVYMLHQWAYQHFVMVLFSVVAIFSDIPFRVTNLGLRQFFQYSNL